MSKQESPHLVPALAAIDQRLLLLEEKFAYQDRTIDALNEVIIGQQRQLDALEDQLLRLKTLLTAGADRPAGGEEPPPPHY